MTPLKVQDLRRRDDGIAMLFVMAIGLIVTGFIVASLASTLQTQRTTRSERNVTSAQAAAEAGLDDAVFQLGQFNASGAANWSALVSGSGAWTQANPNTKTFDTQAKYDVWVTTLAGSSDLIVWAKGTYAGNTRTLRAVVAQSSPPAFGYSMFASKGIDIHHHGSSYLSPQVWTTGVHSNGYINIDYSAEFTVNDMEAVGNLNFSKGGGSTPGASIGPSGYNWYDPLNGKCFPGGMANPAGVPPVSGTTCPYNYSGNAMIAGSIKAGSVTVGSRGQVLPVSAATTMDTGQVISQAPGDITAGTATVGGTTYTQATAANCNASNNCMKGAAAAAGQVSGQLKLTSGYAPPVIPFPSVNYATTYRVKAQSEQDATGKQHVFTSGTQFLSTITAANSGNYQYWDGTAWAAWAPGNTTAPGILFVDGTYDITSGGLSLTYSSMKSLVNAATGTNGPAPILIVRGSLIVETGSVTLNAGLAMVGAGNRIDFVNPGSPTTPPTIDTTKLLDPNATMPAVFAAGGSFKSSDYDTDSGWTASCACYEPDKSTPIYIRGLVYSASWDSTANISTPESQHWHNYDPKNLMKIYGAQVGGTLHDCNNFSFSYDPLVQKAFGFGGGTVYIKDYQELGT